MITGLITGLALDLLGSSGGGAGTQSAAHIPSAISTPADLRAYLCAQPIWTGTPTTFATALGIALTEQLSGEHPAAVQLNEARTDLQADSVGDLAEDGANLRTSVVVAVGRIKSLSASPASWAPHGSAATGPDLNVELEGPDKKEVIYGLIQGRLALGQIVYFPAVVVAVGYAKDGVATSYVVGLAAAITRVPTSGAVRILIEAFAMHSGPRRSSSRPSAAEN